MSAGLLRGRTGGAGEKVRRHRRRRRERICRQWLSKKSGRTPGNNVGGRGVEKKHSRAGEAAGAGIRTARCRHRDRWKERHECIYTHASIHRAWDGVCVGLYLYAYIVGRRCAVAMRCHCDATICVHALSIRIRLHLPLEFDRGTHHIA